MFIQIMGLGGGGLNCYETHGEFLYILLIIIIIIMTL